MSGLEGFRRAMEQLVQGLRTEKVSDRELADLGLSRADFDMLMSGAPGSEKRIEAMAAQFGVDPEMITNTPGLSLHLTEFCGHCSVVKTCQRALEAGKPLPQDQCPNAHIYKALSDG